MADEPTPAPVAEPQHDFSPMDVTADVAADTGHQLSPVNLAVDDDGFESDSLGADDLPIADLRMPPPSATQTWESNAGGEYGRVSYDTPIIGAAEHHFQDNDENIHSTPSKMPSPSRERLASSTRSSRLAGHTSSPRTYPTPTSNSLIEGENPASEPLQDEHQVADEPLQDDEVEEVDPNEQHEEFDSIMESEGFTMISLDTLPSAKQHGIGSSARMASDNPSKILTDREHGRIGERLKRKLPGTIDDLRGDSQQSSARPSPVAEGPSPASRTLSYKQSPSGAVPYPDLPATSPAKSAQRPKRNSLNSLAKLVRVGMALRGPFRPPENEWADDSNISRKKRLGNIFETFSPSTQRELRAAMGLGQELATRETRAAEEAEMETAAESEEPPVEDYGDDEQMEDDEVEDDEVEVVNQPPQMEQISPQKNPSPITRAAQEDRWQLEREAVSRHAQDPTNARRLIYIDSDENGSQHDEFDYKNSVDNRSPEIESVHDEEPVREEFLDEEPLEEEPVDEEQIEDEPIEDEPMEEPFNYRVLGEEHRDYEPKFTSKPQPVLEQEVEEQDVMDYDDDGSDIWQQNEYTEPATEREPESLPAASHTADTEQAAPEDEDDGFDIWQEEAREHSYLSHQSNENAHAAASQPASPPRNRKAYPEHHLSSSPAYVNMDNDDTRYLSQNHVRQLRNQEIDLSAILAEEDTPNRARYYNGTSTPRSILRGHSGADHSSLNGSAVKPGSSQKRVRLQPISQSPDRQSEREHDLAAVHESSPSVQEEEQVHGDESASDAGSHEVDSVHEGLAATPEAPRQPDNDPPASSWLNRITSLTPRWLKAPTKSADDSSSVVSEDTPEEEDQSEHEELADIESAKEINENIGRRSPSDRSSESPWRHVDDPVDVDEPVNAEGPARPSQWDGTDHESPAEDIEESIERNDPSDQDDDAAHSTENVEAQPVQPTGPRPLAVFGYFSDAHYKSLRRLYRMAKRHPERFSYHEAPGRNEILGDWIWTSDGHHGVLITEAQFAIIDRFVHDLSRADVEFGGSGQVEWAEADLHRRLISIIIGEQIREERQAKAARGTSIDTWR